jgi:hypothetical protein
MVRKATWLAVSGNQAQVISRASVGKIVVITTPSSPLPLVFETRLIAYVDVLGWTELIRSPRDSEDVMRKIFAGTSHLEAAIWSEGERRGDFAQAAIPFGKSIVVSYFSDTIIYSCLPEPDEASWVAVQVQRLCGNLLTRGHYTRGAVTVGDLLHDESNGTIVGQALIEAHEIERSVAKYPRVVVADSARDLLVGPRTNLSLNHGPSQCEIDSDGLTFLDIFQKAEGGTRSQRAIRNATAAKPVVEADLAQTFDPTQYPKQALALNHRAKYAWMLAHLVRVLRDPPHTNLLG